ncbi:S-layer homology domain-containing protein [Candidatus Avoscillospira sp. LCP25S3_F1]|uniref:S-layer homology domain-containing protein n=1 Tax=Candidatus Avoscillospira sp. LCP25S3_F1 TaxID=3438825 RepID=UPI003F9027BB
MHHQYIFRTAAALLCAAVLAAPAQARVSLSYINGPGSASAVSSAQGALNQVSPAWLELNPDGSLRLTGASRSFVEEMHQQDMAVLPFLSNHWDRTLGQAALDNREVLTDQLAQVVRDYDLDGISLDLENMTGEHADAYTDMVRLLRQKLPEGKQIAVAVAANPRNFTTGWHASYDYAGLAEWADYLMLMTYDEHYRGGEAGPVASVNFVEQSIRYALERVPAEQLVLGVAFYGRIWGKDNVDVRGVGIREVQIAQLLEQYGTGTDYDKTAAATVSTLVIPETATVNVAGVPLLAGEYTIWHSGAQGRKEILKLVEAYDLLGAGSWSLGQETADTWAYYSLWLHGAYFDDLVGHWSRNHVAQAVHEGWVRGVDEDRFAPESTLTRAQTAALLARLLDLPAGTAAFTDTAGHWAEADIAAAAAAGLVEGRGAGIFAPDAPVTRQELALMLYRAAESPEIDGDVLRDYSDGGSVSDWAKPAMAWAVEQGILTGSGGKLLPRTGTTRAQAVTLLGRYAGTL